MNVTRTTLVGLALVIFAGTLWLYWPSVQGGFLTNMDDDEFIRQAVRLKGLTWDAVKWAFTTAVPFYAPLSRLLHILCYEIWGTNAAGYHATNVVLHALNAALVFGFLWTLLAAVSLTATERLMVAFGVAVVFAIHPLQVESVAWMAGWTQLLCMAFGIGSLWAYVAGARRWVVWALFVAALLSKPMAMSLPFAMLAVDYFPLRRHERLGWGRLLREKAALIALSVAVSVVTAITESRPGGLMVPSGMIRPWERIFLAVQSLTFYPWKLVWPAWLSPYYPLGLGFSLRPVPVLVSALCVVVVTVLSVWRARRTPMLVAGWGAYVMFILPVSGLAQTGGQAVADRYAYLAMLPLLLLAGGAAVWLWRRCAMLSRLALACLLVCEFSFFGLRTRAQTLVWRNDETLWRAVLVWFPNSEPANGMLVQAYNNSGVALMYAGKLNDAIGHYEQALRMNPDLVEAHYNLGVALEQAGRVQEAMEHWEQAVRIKPDYADAHYNLGVALEQAGSVQEAIEHYQQALRIKPDYAEAHNNLGVALGRVGKLEDAIGHFEQALRIKPDYARAHNNLGLTLWQAGKPQEAVGHYEQALRINPDLAEAHYNLGVALEQAGRVQDAIGHYEQALRINPDLAEVQNKLVRLRAAQ